MRHRPRPAVRAVLPDPNQRQSFALAGSIRRWSPVTGELSILDHDLELAPRVSTLEIALGVPVVVAGYDDPATGRRIVTRLVRT